MDYSPKLYALLAIKRHTGVDFIPRYMGCYGGDHWAHVEGCGTYKVDLVTEVVTHVWGF